VKWEHWFLSRRGNKRVKNCYCISGLNIRGKKNRWRKPFLANSEEVKPVEVMRRDRNCPKPRPMSVCEVQSLPKFNIIFLNGTKPSSETVWMEERLVFIGIWNCIWEGMRCFVGWVGEKVKVKREVWAQFQATSFSRQLSLHSLHHFFLSLSLSLTSSTIHPHIYLH